jgi:hypothetical protein
MNEQGQLVWVDDAGTVYAQNPDGSWFRFNVATGLWERHQIQMDSPKPAPKPAPKPSLSRRVSKPSEDDEDDRGMSSGSGHPVRYQSPWDDDDDDDDDDDG